MKTKADFEKILENVTFNDWRFVIDYDTIMGFRTERCYLQIRVDGVCNMSGEPFAWGSRKWFLSPYMTRSEVVQTAFKAVMTAMEHEVREQFMYRGQTIFDPHYDVDKLVALRAKANALDERGAA